MKKIIKTKPLSRRSVLKSLAVSAFSLSVLGINPAQNALAMPRTKEQLQAIVDSIVKTPVGYGSIPSINQYETISVPTAAMSLASDEVVFIFRMPSNKEEVIIMPQKILVWHEVFNILDLGKGYSLTYSPISGTLAFYNTQVRGHNLIFDTNGELYNNNSILIDRNTGSLWSQLYGICIEGPLLGSGLKQEPVIWTRWQNAQEVFPNAKVVANPKSLQQSRVYGRDPYGSFSKTDSYYQNEKIVFPLTHYDPAMKAKTLIYAVEDNTAPIAIDINYVKEKGVVNFFLGTQALAAFYNTKLDTVRVYNRAFWFDRDPALFKYEGGKIQDIFTQSVWNENAECISGKLEGASLEDVYGIYSFWFAYAACNPETFSVPGETVVPDSVLVDTPLNK